MLVGVLNMRLAIREARSLKDKRKVVKSLKDRLRNTFNVSVAEVDENDSYQHAVLAVAMVANEGKFLQSSLSKITDFVRNRSRAELVDYDTEIF